MFVYQSKIKVKDPDTGKLDEEFYKDCLVVVSETVDQGRQIPPVNQPTLCVTEDPSTGTMFVRDNVVFDEDGYVIIDQQDEGL